MASTKAGDVDEADRRINKVVRILLAERHERPGDLARAIEISPSSVSRSLNEDPERHREWKAEDVLRIAVHFSVSPDLLLANEKDMWRLLGERRG